MMEKGQLNTPILFLIFNRVDTTKQVFAKIREIKPKYLFVASDGARENIKGEKELVEETRKIITTIDWDCEVKELFRERNIGCGLALSGAIDWFFENVEAGIILEDDCVPDLSFFSFCETMLDKYKNESRIMHIAGSNFQFGKKRGDGSYYYSSFANIWGWATWRRAWKYFQYDTNFIDDFISKDKLKFYNKNFIERKYWYQKIKKIHNHEVDTWDYQWLFSIWNNGGMSVIPNSNLIENIGFGEGATHTHTEVSVFSKVNIEGINEVISPSNLSLNSEADKFTFTKNFLPKPKEIVDKVLNNLSKKLNKHQ